MGITSKANLSNEPFLHIEVITSSDEEVPCQIQRNIVNHFMGLNISPGSNRTDFNTGNEVEHFKEHPHQSNNQMEISHDSESFYFAIKYPCFYDKKKYYIRVAFLWELWNHKDFHNHYKAVNESAAFVINEMES